MLDALTFADATDDDAEAITAMHVASAHQLGLDFGPGPWARPLIVRRIDAVPGRARVRVGCAGQHIVCALRLQTKKPWAIDASYFTPVSRPLYLVDMVVGPAFQRRGVGRAALGDARRVAAAWPSDAIRLDAWDAPAGAGPFYERCGYAARGHAIYRTAPLAYYEQIVDVSA